MAANHGGHMQGPRLDPRPPGLGSERTRRRRALRKQQWELLLGMVGHPAPHPAHRKQVPEDEDEGNDETDSSSQGNQVFYQMNECDHDGTNGEELPVPGDRGTLNILEDNEDEGNDQTGGIGQGNPVFCQMNEDGLHGACDEERRVPGDRGTLNILEDIEGEGIDQTDMASHENQVFYRMNEGIPQDAACLEELSVPGDQGTLNILEDDRVEEGDECRSSDSVTPPLEHDAASSASSYVNPLDYACDLIARMQSSGLRTRWDDVATRAAAEGWENEGDLDEACEFWIHEGILDVNANGEFFFCSDSLA